MENYGVGEKIIGILGFTSSELTFYNPVHIKPELTFKDISCSHNHVLAIDSDDNLWAWGKSNSYGEIGNGYANDNPVTPIQIKSGTKFSKITASNTFSLALDTSGKLWGWGYNGSGQIGTGNTNNRYSPTNIMPDKTFKEIAAGSSYSLAIDTEGKLWGWGSNNVGQLDVNRSSSDILTPIQLMSEKTFYKIAAGSRTSYAIDSEYNLWSWGSNLYGAVGHGSQTKFIAPSIVLSNIDDVQSTSNDLAVAAIDKNGCLYSWGGNNYSKIQGTTEELVFSPTVQSIESTPVAIYSTDGANFIIDSDGRLWGSGISQSLGGASSPYDYIKLPQIDITLVDGSSSSKIKVPYYDTLPDITIASREGYEFKGFFTETDGNGTKYYSGTGKGLLQWESFEPGTLYANWEIPVYTITLDKQGGESTGTTEIYETHNSKYSLTPDGEAMTSNTNNITIPTKTGYTFGGYYTDTNGRGTKYITNDGYLTSNASTTNFNEDGTLYAKWIPNTYNVTLNTNQGTINSGNITSYTCGVGATLPTNVTKTGHTFGGWYENSNLSGSPVTAISTTDFGDKEYFAKWIADTYTVTLNPNQGTINSGNITSYTYGVGATLPTNVTKNGNSFAGWYTNNTFSGSPVSNIGTTEKGNKTFYAKWIPNIYNVSLNTNEGTINSGNVTSYTYGIGATLPTNVTKLGYTFSGWYTNNAFSGSPVSTISSTDVGDKTFYAKWSIDSYNVTLNPNQGTINSGNITSYTYGVGAILPTDVTKTGHTFDGWYANNTFSGSPITAISTTDSGDKTFYAKWIADTYTVTLNPNEGTINSGNVTSYTYGIGATLPTNVTKLGYTFGGWYENSNLSGNRISAISTTDMGDKEYFAKWTANTDTQYKIEHYKENLTKSGYNLFETENKTGTTGEIVTATSKTYEGFTENMSYSERKITGPVLANGQQVLKLYYDRNVYNVTLNENDGTINSGNVTSYIYGVGATLPTNVTKLGYTFGGWYENSNLSGNRISAISTTDMGDKEYFAKWTANTDTQYKIEHYKENLTKSGYNLFETENKTGTTGEIVTATSKTYEGFTENISYSGRKITGPVLANGQQVLKLYYDRNVYNVTLNENDGTINSGNVTSYIYGVGAILPTDVTKLGYTFGGWYENSDLSGSPVSAISDTDIEDKEYFAKWDANTDIQYKIEHYKENLTKSGYDLFETENKTGTTGEIVTATPKTYEGFTENMSYSERKITGPVLANGQQVLKLYYDRNVYNVTLNENDGTINSGNVTSYIYGVGAILPTDVTKDSFTFDGWYENSNFTGSPVSSISNTDIGDKEYFAKWTANTNIPYKVEHYKENLTKSGYDLFETEDNVGITGEIVTATSKTYEGFTENMSYSERKPSGPILADGQQVLRLYYDRNVYNVILNENGGTINEGNINSYIYGTVTQLPINVSKENFEFQGWYENSNFTGNPISRITNTDIGDKEYFAKWKNLLIYIIKPLDSDEIITKFKKFYNAKEYVDNSDEAYGVYDLEGNLLYKKNQAYYIYSDRYIVRPDKKIIKFVSPKTSAQVFKSNIDTNGTIVKITNSKGKELGEQDIVTTNSKVTVVFDNKEYEYTISVRGDLDENGLVTITDLSIMNQALIKNIELTGIFEVSADLNNDEKISITDLSVMNKALLTFIQL